MDRASFVSHLGRVIKFDLLSRPAQPINEREDLIFDYSDKRVVELQAICFKFSTEKRCFEEELLSSIRMSRGFDGRILMAKCVRESHTGLLLPCVLLQNCKCTQEFDTSLVVLASSSNKMFLYGEWSSKYAIPIDNVQLMDGPCACWRIDELKAFQVAKRDPASGRFKVTEFVSEARASSIMYCSMSPRNDLHIISISQLNETSSWQWNSLRSNSKNPCSITPCKFVPAIYASIACCILVMIPEQIGEQTPSLSSSAVSWLENTTYVATSMRQLLKFTNGTFCKLASLSFDDAVDIVAMETRGERVLVVRSKGGETCVISCSSFQVIQEWKNVSSSYVDDFLGNGRDELLMILNPDALRSFPEFILTDLDLCLVSDQVLHDGKGHDVQPTPRSLVTAMHSLEAKVESGLMSLREQEQIRRLKDCIISKSIENLAEMALGIPTPPQRKPSLVHLCGPLCGPTSPNTSRQGTSHRLKVTSGWQRTFNDKWVIGCTVANENQWSVSDVKLLVLPWKTKSSFQEPGGCEGYVQHPLSEGSAMDTAAEADSQELHAVPSSKRSKLQTIHDTASTGYCATSLSSSSSSKSAGPAGTLSSPASLLLPGASCDVVATTMIPNFLAEPIAFRVLVLQWTSQHPFPQGERSRKKRLRMVICGDVHVCVADVLGGKLAVKLPDVSPMIIRPFTLMIPNDQNEIEKQVLSRRDELVMDTSQLSISVQVLTRYIPLPDLKDVLFKQMKFQRTGEDGCVCINGVLMGSRVYLYNVKSNSVLLRVCTRGKMEQMLFFHTLKSILPVDVEFTSDTPRELMEEAIRKSVNSMNKELHHNQDITDMACSTLGTGTIQHKMDGEGTPMEQGGIELKSLKRLRDEFQKQQQTTKPKECSLLSNEAQLVRFELLQLREYTDNTVTVLSKCI